MIKEKSGNVLVFTIIVFAVVMITGTGLLGRVITNQNISQVQMDKQQAYYTAKSSLGAYITAFEDKDNAMRIDQVLANVPRDQEYRLVSNQPFIDKGSYSIGLRKNDAYVDIISYGKYKNEQVVIEARLNKIRKGSNLLGEYIFLGPSNVVLPYSQHNEQLRIEGDIKIWGAISLWNTIHEGKVINEQDPIMLSIQHGTDNTIWHKPSNQEGDVFIAEYVEDGKVESAKLIFLEENTTISLKKEDSFDKIKENNELVIYIAHKKDIEFEIGGVKDPDQDIEIEEVYIYNPGGRVIFNGVIPGSEKSIIDFEGAIVAQAIQMNNIFGKMEIIDEDIDLSSIQGIPDILTQGNGNQISYKFDRYLE